MAKTVFAMITLLEDGAFGGMRPDQSLPGHEGSGDPGYDRPIHHPGHPDHGLPSRPVHPGNRPPGSAGGRPDNSLPWSPGSPDQGLPVPPGVTPPPAPGGALRDKLVVLWHVPGQAEWQGMVIDPASMEQPDQGLPAQPPPRPGQGLPETPAPKG
jgi:hypothetical protein